MFSDTNNMNKLHFFNLSIISSLKFCVGCRSSCATKTSIHGKKSRRIFLIFFASCLFFDVI